MAKDTTKLDASSRECSRLAAYYGAWYYVPAPAANSGTWNLFHFQGGVPGTTLRGLWDVSLVNMGSGGPLHVILYDSLDGMVPNANAVTPLCQRA